MSATVSLEPRRAGGSSRTPARELPVLFHLMDVSLLRPQPSVPEHVPAAAEPEVAVLEPSVPEFVEPGVAESEITEPVPVSPAVCEFAPPDPLPDLEIKPLIDPDPAAAEVERIEPLADMPADASNSPIAESPPAPVSEITPRPSEARPPRSKSRARNDWFTAHGKYIAIGFVLALAATIYWARANRGSVAAIVDSQPHAHPGEAGDQLASQSKPATVIDESKAEAKSATTPGIAEVSPAKLADAPISQQKPQTDLHAPTIPQLTSEPASDESLADNNLFPWGERSEERVASRPDVPASAPPEKPGPQYPLTDANAGMSQSYSTGFTSAGPQGAGTFGPPPSQPGIQNNSGNQFPNSTPELASGPGLGGATVGPPSGGSPPPYTPQDNTARGYRYERTGSGPY